MDSLRFHQHPQHHRDQHQHQQHKHQHQQHKHQHHSGHQVESKEDASDAVRKVNGQNFNGGRIRVELANACSDSEPRDSGSRAR